MPENSIPTPYALAMVVCDYVWRDPYSGKNTIIGTFSSIGGPTFPWQHPIISVYVSLTDGRGDVPVRIELVDCDELRDPVLGQTLTVTFPDPRAIAEVVFLVQNVIFPEPGEYRLKLFAHEEFLMERRLFVLSPIQDPSEHHA